MPPQPTPITPAKILNDNANQGVASILNTQEQALKAQVPSMFSDILSKMPSPTKVFNDYTVTNNPVFKQASSNALTALQLFADKTKSMLAPIAAKQSQYPVGTNPQQQMGPSNPLFYDRTQAMDQTIPTAIPDKYKGTFFDISNKLGVNVDTMAQIMKKETGGDPFAVHKNKDGTIDQGLMQINSTNLKAVSQYFNSTGRHFDPFNANDSIEAAAYLIKQNTAELKDKLGRNPTQAEIYDAYNLGVGGFMKAIQGNKDEQNLLQKYEAGSEFAAK